MIITIASRHTPNLNESFWHKTKVKFVQFWTFGKYYHSEIIIGDKWVSAHIEDGIQVYKLQELNHLYWDYQEIEVNEAYFADVWNFIYENIGVEYDWLGIYLSQGVPLDIHDPDKWFCSEIVIAILQLFKEETALKLIPHRTSPNKINRVFLQTFKQKEER